MRDTHLLSELAHRLTTRHLQIFNYCNEKPDEMFNGCLAAMKEVILAIHDVLEAPDKNTCPTPKEHQEISESKWLKLQASRYEIVRKLNVSQFAQLFQRNVNGENFDEMIDKLIEELTE